VTLDDRERKRDDRRLRFRFLDGRLRFRFLVLMVI